MREKQDAGIREKLCRKRILVLGPESDMKQKLLQVFREDGLRISENAEEMSPEDYVILFGFSDQFPEERKPEVKDGSAGSWKTFSSLTRILDRIESARPESVLFVSRADVYGKLFGDFHPVKEDEMGYVCHTSVRDQEAAHLRILENLCFRMAREDGIKIRIVRFPDAGFGSAGRRTGKQADRDFWEYGRQNWKYIAEMTVRVLLGGIAGEAYNIDGSLRITPEESRTAESSEKRSADLFVPDEDMNQKDKNEQKTAGYAAQNNAESAWTAFADTTALEPIRIVMDTGKAGRLG